MTEMIDFDVVSISSCSFSTVLSNKQYKGTDYRLVTNLSTKLSGLSRFLQKKKKIENLSKCIKTFLGMYHGFLRTDTTNNYSILK